MSLTCSGHLQLSNIILHPSSNTTKVQMTDITSKKINCNSCDIHFLSAGNEDDIPVIFLHGMKFQAATWQELGTLKCIADAGFHAIALDMPGFGRSPACSVEQDSVLQSFFQELGLQKAILIGPSMGGRISLEFTVNHPDLIQALVLVGAVGVEENKSELASIKVPTLLVWGSNDQISPLKNCDLLVSTLPTTKKIIIEGAPHPCYLDNPNTWHTVLIDFLNSQAR